MNNIQKSFKAKGLRAGGKYAYGLIPDQAPETPEQFRARQWGAASESTRMDSLTGAATADVGLAVNRGAYGGRIQRRAAIAQQQKDSAMRALDAFDSVVPKSAPQPDQQGSGPTILGASTLPGVAMQQARDRSDQQLVSGGRYAGGFVPAGFGTGPGVNPNKHGLAGGVQRAINNRDARMREAIGDTPAPTVAPVQAAPRPVVAPANTGLSDYAKDDWSRGRQDDKQVAALSDADYDLYRQSKYASSLPPRAKAKGYARGAVIPGHDTTGRDDVDVKVTRGEAILPVKTVDAMGGSGVVGELIQRTNGKAPAGLKAAGNYATGMRSTKETNSKGLDGVFEAFDTQKPGSLTNWSNVTEKPKLGWDTQEEFNADPMVQAGLMGPGTVRSVVGNAASKAVGAGKGLWQGAKKLFAGGGDDATQATRPGQWNSRPEGLNGDWSRAQKVRMAREASGRATPNLPSTEVIKPSLFGKARQTVNNNPWKTGAAVAVGAPPVIGALANRNDEGSGQVVDPYEAELLKKHNAILQGDNRGKIDPAKVSEGDTQFAGNRVQDKFFASKAGGGVPLDRTQERVGLDQAFLMNRQEGPDARQRLNYDNAEVTVQTPNAPRTIRGAATTPGALDKQLRAIQERENPGSYAIDGGKGWRVDKNGRGNGDFSRAEVDTINAGIRARGLAGASFTGVGDGSTWESRNPQAHQEALQRAAKEKQSLTDSIMARASSGDKEDFNFAMSQASGLGLREAVQEASRKGEAWRRDPAGVYKQQLVSEGVAADRALARQALAQDKADKLQLRRDEMAGAAQQRADVRGDIRLKQREDQLKDMFPDGKGGVDMTAYGKVRSLVQRTTGRDGANIGDLGDEGWNQVLFDASRQGASQANQSLLELVGLRNQPEASSSQDMEIVDEGKNALGQKTYIYRSGREVLQSEVHGDTGWIFKDPINPFKKDMAKKSLEQHRGGK